MYITKEELEQRLKRTEVQIVERERKVRKPERRLTHEDRVLIGVLEETDTQKNIADLVGVSQMTVSNASRALTSPTIGLDKELRDDIKERVEDKAKEALSNNKKIEEQLVTNLAAALGQVAGNLHNTSATEASKIATDMSKILDRVNGDKDNGKGNKTAIIINVPAMREEKHYQSITV